jgi:hypothetical protein
VSSRNALLFRRRVTPILLGLSLLFPVPGFAADELGQEFSDYFEITRPPWTFSLGGNGGMNKMGKGYDGYDDMPHGGADFYIRPPVPEAEEPACHHKFMLRVSADYFPLQVPEGVFGLTEDVYGLTFAVLVRLRTIDRQEHSKWVPFLGVGAGLYQDRIKLESPASGTVTGAHNYFGINFSGGFFFPEVMGIRLVPEVRQHMLRTPGNFSATNTCFQLGAAIRLGGGDE